MTNTTPSGPARERTTHRGMRAVLSIVAAAALALVLVGVGAPAPAAHAAPFAHCDSVDNTAGLGLECDIVIVNNLDLTTGVTSSTTTVTECHGAANTARSSCTGPTVTSSTELITSVSQCNSSLDGGGASMRCDVRITNNIVGDATAVGVTVNQCNDSLGGGGILVRDCDPDPASTSGAVVSQCNNSVNGGGSTLVCDVVAGSTASAALGVTVSQCNFSANGGGSIIDCGVQLTTLVTAPAEDVGGSGSGSGTDAGIGSRELAATARGAVISPLPGVLLVTIGLLVLAIRRAATTSAAREIFIRSDGR